MFVDESIRMHGECFAQLAFVFRSGVKDCWHVQTASANLLQQPDTIESGETKIGEQDLRVERFAELKGGDAVGCFACNIKATVVPQDETQHVLDGHIVFGEKHTRFHAALGTQICSVSGERLVTNEWVAGQRIIEESFVNLGSVEFGYVDDSQHAAFPPRGEYNRPGERGTESLRNRCFPFVTWHVVGKAKDVSVTL